MSKEKKNRKEDNHVVEKIVLITVLIQLIQALIELINKLIE